jgi:hypothetical protein
MTTIVIETSSRRKSMFKHKTFWIVGALALIGAVTLVGCSEERNAEYGGGRGPGRAYESDQDLAERGQGRGRQGVSEVSPVQASGPVASEAGSGRRGAGNSRVAPDAEERGELLVLSGRLADKDGEWYLRTGDGSIQLGFGPSSYRESAGIQLIEGADARVRGHMMEEGEIAVITCETNGELYAFRTEEGVPMWSGRYRNGSVADGVDQTAEARRGGGRRGGGRGGRAG